MKLLPIENIVFKTKLKEDEVIKRLSNSVEPQKKSWSAIFGAGSIKPYEGQIYSNTFDISRNINYRNSFLPQINGVIEQGYDGTTIKVKMRLHVLVIVFLCVWCSIVGGPCLNILTQALTDNLVFQPMSLIPLGMLIFMYGITMGGFKYESSKAKKYLKVLFEADIVGE